MGNFIGTLLITAVALFIVARLNLGLHIQDIPTTLIAALVLGLLNAILRPILNFLALPITILTLGLFALVINALIIMLMAAIVPGVRVDGFLAALIVSIVLSILTWIISAIVR